MEFLSTVFYFVLALGILVFIHEWGHYIVALKSGVKVEKFSIGFGPKIFSFKKGQTEFQVSIIPLGGFVKLFGQDPIAESEGDPEKAEWIAHHPESFSKKPLFNRMATVFAGPVMNLILFAFLMPLVFMLGRDVPKIMKEEAIIVGIASDSPAQEIGLEIGDKIIAINDLQISSWEDISTWILIHPETTAHLKYLRNGEEKESQINIIQAPFTEQKAGYTGFEPLLFIGQEPIIGEVLNGKPASNAGIQAMDEIISINNQKVDRWSAMTAFIQENKDEPINLKIKRDNDIKSFTLTPEFNDEYKIWQIGIAKYQDPDFMIKEKYDFIPAIKAGFHKGIELTGLTLSIVKRLFTGNMSLDSLGGPIKIAEEAGNAAKRGAGDFIYLMAFLSLQLGILNLLPIPVLDGGHIVFMAFEGIFRKPVPYKLQNLLSHIGMILLLVLMIYVSFNDVDHIFGIRDFFKSLF